MTTEIWKRSSVQNSPKGLRILIRRMRTKDSLHLLWMLICLIWRIRLTNWGKMWTRTKVKLEAWKSLTVSLMTWRRSKRKCWNWSVVSRKRWMAFKLMSTQPNRSMVLPKPLILKLEESIQSLILWFRTISLQKLKSSGSSFSNSMRINLVETSFNWNCTSRRK